MGRIAQLAKINYLLGSGGMGDRLSTGANARLQVTFRDNSVLTLGEQANVVVDRNRAGAVRLSSPGMGTDIPLHKRRWRKAQR